MLAERGVNPIVNLWRGDLGCGHPEAIGQLTHILYAAKANLNVKRVLETNRITFSQFNKNFESVNMKYLFC